jgi:hypothetical protein
VVDTHIGTRAAAQESSDKLTVLNPMGYPPKISPKALAPRLDSLNGKTVFLVDCRFDDSDVFLTQVHAWFAEHLPQVDTRLVRLSSVYTRDDPETWEHIRANGDAALLGVGH